MTDESQAPTLAIRIQDSPADAAAARRRFLAAVGKAASATVLGAVLALPFRPVTADCDRPASGNPASTLHAMR